MQKKLIVFLVFAILSLTTQLSAMHPDIVDLTDAVENTGPGKRKAPPSNPQPKTNIPCDALNKKIKTGMTDIDCSSLSTILYKMFQKKKNNEIDTQQFDVIKANVLERVREHINNKTLYYREVFDMPELPLEMAHFLFNEASTVIPRIYYLTCLRKESFPTPTHYFLHVIHASHLLINSLTKGGTPFSSEENKILRLLPDPLLYSVLFNAQNKFVKNKIQDTIDTELIKKFEFMQKHFLKNSQERWAIETPDVKTEILITMIFPRWKHQKIFFFKESQIPVRRNSSISTSSRAIPTKASIPSFAKLMDSLSGNLQPYSLSAKGTDKIDPTGEENTEETPRAGVLESFTPSSPKKFSDQSSSFLPKPNGYLSNFSTPQPLNFEFQNAKKPIYYAHTGSHNKNDVILFSRHKTYKKLKKTYYLSDPCSSNKVILPKRIDNAPMSIEDYEIIKTELEKIDPHTLNEATQHKPQEIIKLIDEKIQKLRGENNHGFIEKQLQLFQKLQFDPAQALQPELSNTGHVLQQDDEFETARLLHNLQSSISPLKN